MLHNINFKYQQIRYQNARSSNLKKIGISKQNMLLAYYLHEIG